MNFPDSLQIPAVSHRPLTGRDHRTLALAALGGALEFYDFVIYVFFATVIGQLFFPPSIPDWLRQLQTFGIFAAGYLARPLGGVVLAHFGDLVGRKRMFTLSVMMMAQTLAKTGRRMKNSMNIRSWARWARRARRRGASARPR